MYTQCPSSPSQPIPISADSFHWAKVSSIWEGLKIKLQIYNFQKICGSSFWDTTKSAISFNVPSRSICIRVVADWSQVLMILWLNKHLPSSKKFPALLCDGAVSCLFPLTIDATDEAFSMFHTKRGRWLLAEILLRDLQKRPTTLPTPRKINMEPENFSPGKWKIIFQTIIFRFLCQSFGVYHITGQCWCFVVISGCRLA